MRVPSHTTVVAYLALFVAIGGSAYAVSKVGSVEIKNRSILGKDVADDTLGGRQIDELKVAGPLAVGDEQSGGCDPVIGAAVDCIGQTIKLKRESGLLVIATASKGATGGTGFCAMAVDRDTSNGQTFGGPESDGFSLTKVTSRLSPGPHSVALRCEEISPDFRVSNPTIAAVAVDVP
jgi:hypothetical protein